MKLFQKKYPLNLVEIIKARIANYLLHAYAKKYTGISPALAIFSRDHIGIRYQIEGIYEIHYLRLLTDWLAGNREILSGTVLDIGANIGNHSVYFSRFFNKVIAFEPNPATFQLLKYNASLVDNVIIHNLAVSDREGEAKMSLRPGDMGGAYVDSQGTVPVKMTTVDSLVTSEEKISLIKIDVEGHELPALQGCAASIARHRPIIAFEQHLRDFAPDGKSRVIEYLRSLGYNRFAILTDDVKTGFPGDLVRKFKKLLHCFAGSETKTIEILEDLKPGFYQFLLAIHKDSAIAPGEIARNPE